MLKTRPYTLIDRLAIRDTNPRDSEAGMDLSRSRAWGFEVHNGHDQAVTVELTNGATRAGTGVTATIPANTVEPIVTDIWLPSLGVRTSYAVAPTTGALSVKGWVQEES